MEVFGLRAHESVDSVFTFLVPPEGFWVDSVSNVIDAAVLLSNSDNNGTSFSEEFRSPIADITKTLNNNLLSSNSGLNAKLLSHFLIVENLASGVENTESC